MKISQEDLFDSDLYQEISDDITDHRRWCVVHAVVVKKVEDGTFWKGFYERGATENQDSGYDDDIELFQVWPWITTTVTYLPTEEKKA